MATLDKLLVQLLRQGTTVQVQHLAATAARKGGQPAAALWQALAACPTLDRALWTQVATCNIATARKTLWERPDLDTETRLTYLPREGSRAAVQALLAALPSRKVAHATLRNRMTRVHADALVADGLAHWPADIVATAIRRSDGNENLQALGASGHDLSNLVADATVRRSVRFAACASVGTPDATVAAHLADIVRPTPREDIQELVPLLAKRTPNAEVLAALKSGLEESGSSPVRWSSVEGVFTGWWGGNVPSELVLDRIKLCTTPAQLEDLWGHLTLGQRQSYHREFHEHRLCSGALHRQLQPDCVRTTSGECWAPNTGAGLWLRQDLNLLKDRVTAKGGFSAFGQNALWMLDVAAECPWSLPAATLMDTFVDLSLEDLAAGTRLEAPVWAAKLVRHPAFPRHRAAEMPAEVLIAALDTAAAGENHSIRWLVEDLSTRLAELVGREADALPLLAAALTSDKPVHGVVQAAATALATG